MTSRRMSNASNDQRYFQSYDQFQVHELMLRDRPRVAAYHDAMMNNKHLFQDKVVLDVGSGTGILSLFAAKAGARLVYAVDACPSMCDLAEELIRCNGLKDRIQVINKQLEDIDKFDQQIDIIISEWMGFYLFHESMLESVIYARDHFLCPALSAPTTDTREPNDSILIFPSHAYLYCAPFVDQHVRLEQNTMWKNYFGLDMSPILPHIKNSDLSECVIDTIESSQLVHEPQLVQAIDLRTVQIEDLQSMRASCQFDIDNTCIISGFCFWFDCYFSSNHPAFKSPSVRLSTGPSTAKTHWKQTLVFLPEDIYPLKGELVPVSIKLKQSTDNRRHYNLAIAIKKLREEMDGDAENEVTDAPPGQKRRRHRSSTLSSDTEAAEDKEVIDATADSDDDDDEDDDEDEHPIPCPCDREKCKLIRMIIEKFDEGESVE